MTAPIKPPGGPGARTPDLSAGGQVDKPSTSFRDVVGADEATKIGAGTEGPEGAERAALDGIVEDLAAGRIDQEAAIDRLVARALATPTAAALPPVRRAELEAFLRSRLAEDPTLIALTDDLQKG